MNDMVTAPVSPALESLPPVFSLADLKQLLPGHEDNAQALVLRWVEAGLVRQTMPPRPVFVRVSLGEPLTEEQICHSLKRAYPSVVMVGGSALWRQQLSLEQDLQLHCCVQEQDASCTVREVRLHWRPVSWWEAIRRAGGLAGEWYGVPMLSPEMAVADATAFGDVWMPDREMIHWDRFSSDSLSQASDLLRAIA